jgi:peptidoglycan/LPS O-acetylase OafA/YrhL
MNRRIDSIDGWRIIAAVGVLYGHTWGFYNNLDWMVGGVNIMRALYLWGYGVHLFYVISGFCFYLILYKQETFTFRTAVAFWKKRWLRLAPAFYVACIVYALYNYTEIAWNLPYRLLCNFLFIQNYMPNAKIGGLFWSLAVEAHFYLLLPLIFWGIRKVGVLRTVGFILGFHVLLNLLYYKLYYKGIDFRVDEWWYTTGANIGHFAWGILVGYLYSTSRRLKFFSRWWSIFAGLVLAYIGRTFIYSRFLAVTGSAAWVFQGIGPLLMTMGFACMIYSSLENETLSRIWGNRYLAGLGRVSYSFYLWHSLILSVVFISCWRYLPMNAGGVFLMLLLLLAILIPVSFLSYRLFESFYFRRQLQLSTTER